ncbi:unannotated protein [freshwater metagenome]|uniref:Unannotated protein n=1 Tax=freshwater metagenome TaxID=449393 RepID=A0A6J6UIN2_9ZZZZ
MAEIPLSATSKSIIRETLSRAEVIRSGPTPVVT